MQENLGSMATGSFSPYFSPQPTGSAPYDPSSKRQPLLMQRPQSSGIDMTGFSFAKPAAKHKGFSLPPPSKQGLINLNPTWAASTVETQHKGGGQDEQLRTPKNLPLAEPEPQRFESSGENGTSHWEQHDTLRITGPSNCKHLDRMTETASLEKDQSSGLTNGPKARVHTILPVGSSIHIDTEINTSRTSSNLSAPDQQGRTRSGTPIPLASRPSTHLNNDCRVSKRRRQNQNDVLLAKHHSFTGKTVIKQPTEEKLFELLIGKIRQREEKEAATVELQCQLEEQNLRLKDENQRLKHRREADHEKLQKTASESNDYRSQMDHWKEKLRRFKQVVNELGSEYDTLRDEANKFKVITASLEKEKSDLLQAIHDIRIQISRAEDTIDKQKTQMSESEARFSVLQQTLKASEEMGESVKVELASEKQRSVMLESYIQNYTRTQTRQLLLIREDQCKLIESVNSGIQFQSEESTSTKDALLREVRICADRLCTSVETLSDKCTTDRMEIQDFTNTVHDAVSRLDTVSTHFITSVETSTAVNSSVSDKVQGNLQLIEQHLGTESTLLKQLGNCESSSENLRDNITAIEPTLRTLDISVRSLETTESILLDGLSGFSEKLAEAQIQPASLGLELELSNKFAENTELQLRLQALSLEAEFLQQRLRETEAQVYTLNNSLKEETAERQKVENHSHKIETEKLAIQGELVLAEQKIRQELDKEKTTATDEIRHEYEQNLQTLQREKEDLENGSEEVLAQLGGVRDSLVEAKRIVDDQRRDREALAEETEQQIQELTASYSEAMARLDSQAMQIEQYQVVETASTIEKSDLREQLKQAQEKNQELEHTLTLTAHSTDLQESSARNIVPFATFGNRMSPEIDQQPYDDPADFAMLFITDESAAPSPCVKSTKPLPSNTESTIAKTDLPRPMKDDKGVFDIPENTDQPHFTRKRKAVNFDAVPSRNNSKTTVRANSGSMQVQGGLEGHLIKPSKHVHKFTYSRVHTTSTQIQQEQSAGPVRPAIAERQTSPKCFVSASSGNHPAGKPNTRGRGRRRSRGERYDARFSQED